MTSLRASGEEKSIESEEMKKLLLPKSITLNQIKELEEATLISVHLDCCLNKQRYEVFPDERDLILEKSEEYRKILELISTKPNFILLDIKYYDGRKPFFQEVEEQYNKIKDQVFPIKFWVNDKDLGEYEKKFGSLKDSPVIFFGGWDYTCLYGNMITMTNFPQHIDKFALCKAQVCTLVDKVDYCEKGYLNWDQERGFRDVHLYYALVIS
jgi:hypothetical protein